MKSFCLAAAAFVAMLAGIQTSSATTFTVFDVGAFDAQTTNRVTTNFDDVGPLDAGDPTCPGSGSCFAGFNPVILDHGITLTTPTTPADPHFVNVNSAGFYGVNDLTHPYAVNATTHTVSINLPTAVTAFGLDFGSLFEPTKADFLLSNGFTENDVATLGSLKTQFIGFISDQVFSQITLTVPDDESFVVADMTTASATTPIPGTLPLFASGLLGAGLLGWRQRRSGASPAPLGA